LHAAENSQPANWKMLRRSRKYYNALCNVLLIYYSTDIAVQEYVFENRRYL